MVELRSPGPPADLEPVLELQKLGVVGRAGLELRSLLPRAPLAIAATQGRRDRAIQSQGLARRQGGLDVAAPEDLPVPAPDPAERDRSLPSPLLDRRSEDLVRGHGARDLPRPAADIPKLRWIDRRHILERGQGPQNGVE